jgi:hypothetical protein
VACPVPTLLTVRRLRWCDTCNAFQLGAVATLIDIRTYADAVSLVARHGGRRADYVDIIKDLANAKGLPKRATEAALNAFFGP